MKHTMVEKARDLRTEKKTVPAPMDARVTKRIGEEVRLLRSAGIVVSAVVGALIVSIAVLWGIHRSDIAALQLQLLERSKDRITSQQVMQLLNMHADQPHKGAAREGVKR